MYWPEEVGTRQLTRISSGQVECVVGNKTMARPANMQLEAMCWAVVGLLLLLPFARGDDQTNSVELITSLAVRKPCPGVLLLYEIREIVRIPSEKAGIAKPFGFRARMQLLNGGKR